MRLRRTAIATALPRWRGRKQAQPVSFHQFFCPLFSFHMSFAFVDTTRPSIRPSNQLVLRWAFSFPFSRSPHRQFWLKLLLGRPRFVLFIFLPWSRFILLLLLLLIERPPFFLFNALRHLIINRPSVSYIYVLVVCGVLRACVDVDVVVV